MKSYLRFIVGVLTGAALVFTYVAYEVTTERDYVACMLDSPNIDDTELCEPFRGKGFPRPEVSESNYRVCMMDWGEKEDHNCDQFKPKEEELLTKNENIVMMSCEHDVTYKYNAFSDANELIETVRDDLDTSLEINLESKTIIPGGSSVVFDYTERGNEIFWSTKLKVSDRTNNIWTDLINRVSGSYETTFNWCTDNKCKKDKVELYNCKQAEKIF